MDLSLENVKIAVALRAARTALGWNQQEFADRMEVAKSTIARIETLEMTPKADFLTKALRIYRDAGVEIELRLLDKVSFTVEMPGLQEAMDRLANEQMRRSDRKGKVNVAGPAAPRLIPPKKKTLG